MTGTAVPAFPRRGEIWSVELPNQPADPHMPRPALIISVDVRNRLAGDVLVVPLSTNLRPLPTHVLIPAGAGGQRHDSMAKCEQITTLDKRFLVYGPLGGHVPASLLDQVVRAVRRAIGEVLP
ncbi:MAG: type II toxin-antitoxin system PemK/MazF family toxin [Chloroflexota bacterium]